ncbi:MAG: YfhO family protein [Thermoleophilaceae bacterium]|nr:YfhO family protein [Thermoleophilaceae bacterium]
MRRRPVTAAALVYLVLAVAVFAHGMVPGRALSASDFLWTATPWQSSRPAEVPALGSNRELGDAVNKFQPSLEYTRAHLPDVPLWDPHVLSGRPYFADPQALIWSPFSLPAYVLPFWQSLAVIAALKLFVAAFGAFLLGRALGMRFAAALMTGLVFGFSLWCVFWVSWNTMGIWPFLPWICLLAELTVRRPGPLPWAGLAAVTGLQWLGGHPSSSFQMLFVVGCFWTGRVLLDPVLRNGFPRRLLALGTALAAGTALAGVALIPFVELLSHSDDVNARTGLSGTLFQQPPKYLLGFFMHDFWGAGRTSYEFAAKNQEHAWYVAALPLMLVVAAFVSRPTWTRVAVFLVGAASLLIATGQPPLFDLLTSLPGFKVANNSRFGVITVMCLAVLAGWGMDDLMAGRLRERRRALLVGASALLVIGPVIVVAAGGNLHLDLLGRALRAAWLFDTPQPELLATPDGPFVVKLASALEWLLPAVLALALVAALAARRISPSAFAALGLVLVALDLVKAGADYNPSIRESHAEQPVTGSIRYLQAHRPARFAGLEPLTLSLAPPLPPNLALRYDVYDARGDAIPGERRYTELWRQVIGRNRNCYSFFCTVAAVADPASYRALGLLGVQYLLQNRGDDPLPGLEEAYDGPDARIYRNPSALPRAFLVTGQQVLPDDDAQLLTVASEGFRPLEAAITDEPVPGLPQGAQRGAGGEARIQRYDDDEVTVATSSSRPGLMVLTDAWYPGWKAEVDGRDAEVRRVDYVLRGVSVPAGEHTVVLRYEPSSWRLGWITSLVALILIGGVAAVGFRRRGGDRAAA